MKSAHITSKATGRLRRRFLKRYVPSPISQLIAILLALLSADAYTWSYSDADAAANAMSEMKHEKTDEQQSEDLEAVTNFYRSAKPCVQLGEKELIIISIDSEGSVIDAVAQNSNEKTTCLLALISKFSFAKPPWQPYYLKVQM